MNFTDLSTWVHTVKDVQTMYLEWLPMNESFIFAMSLNLEKGKEMTTSIGHIFVNRY